MVEPQHARRTTVLVGLLLALLLAVAYAVVSVSTTASEPHQGPDPRSLSSTRQAPTPTPSPTPTPLDPPTAGSGYPVRKVGALQGDRSVLVNGRGNAELRYRRAPRNGTRLHFICTGCDADTWLVELPSGSAVGEGPLADPADVISALDTVRPGDTTSLLVKAPATARWTATLTPFDAIPVHEQTFDALGDDVVAVRVRTDLQLTCGGAAVLRTLARTRPGSNYAVVQRRREDAAGSWPVVAPTGGELMIMVVSCPGRWTVTLP